MAQLLGPSALQVLIDRSLELETLVVVKEGRYLGIEVSWRVCTTNKVVQGVSNENLTFKSPKAFATGLFDPTQHSRSSI
jgi:hypothetical protein